MKDWKSILLSTGSFIDNDYLYNYIDLITKPNDVFPYMERHHVIPVAYYKHKYNIDTRKHRHEAERYANADDQNTVVLLSFANHCKAHWLLAKCTIDKLAIANATAFLKQISALKRINEKIFLNRKNHVVEVGLTDSEYELLQQYILEVKSDSSNLFWSLEQDEWLRQNRYSYTAKQCAEILDKTEKAILCRCNKLGLKKVWYTDDENAEFLKYSETHTAKECAIYFETSEHNIIKRWRDLGFSKTFKWTDEMDTWLRENDGKYTVAEIAEHFGTTKTVIMGRRWKLGITRYDRPDRRK